MENYEDYQMNQGKHSDTEAWCDSLNRVSVLKAELQRVLDTIDEADATVSKNLETLGRDDCYYPTQLGILLGYQMIIRARINAILKGVA